MPFEDESTLVELVPWRPGWAAEFVTLGAALAENLAGIARAIDHVGSTSIPGMPAKDVIDAQIRVSAVDDAAVASALAELGFRLRPEPWNRAETVAGTELPKAVYAPPPGSRPVNVHIRPAAAPNTRYALLFRDFLRADPDARDAWGAFKEASAAVTDDLAEYGQIKSAAMPPLMARAERWAAESGWTPRRDGDLDVSPAGS